VSLCNGLPLWSQKAKLSGPWNRLRAFRAVRALTRVGASGIRRFRASVLVELNSPP
jgi:hypothetical protein